MARDTSGKVSKRETIEALIVSARTGILKPSLRTIPIPYVRFQSNIHSSSVGMVDSSFSSRDVLGCC